MIKIKEKQVPLYKGTFVMVISDDLEKIKEIDPGFEASDLFAHSILRSWKDGTGFLMILNPENDHKLTPGVVAHEAFHLVNFVATERGFIPSFDNDEPQAYLVTWFVDRMDSFLRKEGYSVEKGWYKRV